MHRCARFGDGLANGRVERPILREDEASRAIDALAWRVNPPHCRQGREPLDPPAFGAPAETEKPSPSLLQGVHSSDRLECTYPALTGGRPQARASWASAI